MSIEPAIRTILRNDSAVADLVGSRIFYVNKDQNITADCIVLEQISTIRNLVMSGPNGYSNGTMQVSCFSATYEGVKGLSVAVTNALHGYADTIANTVVDFIKVTGDNDIPVVPENGKQRTNVYGVSLDAEYQVQE